MATSCGEGNVGGSCVAEQAGQVLAAPNEGCVLCAFAPLPLSIHNHSSEHWGYHVYSGRALLMGGGAHARLGLRNHSCAPMVGVSEAQYALDLGVNIIYIVLEYFCRRLLNHFTN